MKYHLGGVKTTSSYGIEQRISLANNPSHLEIVAPVVIGKTRASQDDTKHIGKPTTDFHKRYANYNSWGSLHTQDKVLILKQ